MKQWGIDIINCIYLCHLPDCLNDLSSHVSLMDNPCSFRYSTGSKSPGIQVFSNHGSSGP